MALPDDCGPDERDPQTGLCYGAPPDGTGGGTGGAPPDNHGCPSGTVWTITDPASGYGFCASPGYKPTTEDEDERARQGQGYGDFQFPDYEGFDYNVDIGNAPRFTGTRFTPATLAEAENEPGYAFARDEGLGALGRSNASKGISRTGGAFKGLIGWGNQFAEQNYGNVNNRKFQKWGADFDVDKAEYAPLLTGWLTNAAAKQRAKELSGGDAFRKWLARLDFDKFVLGQGAA